VKNAGIYDVILNFGPAAGPPHSFFGSFADEIALLDGSTLYRLECSQLADEGHYLALVLSERSRHPQFPLKVPHALVLVIVDTVYHETKFGFAPSEKPS
jgi:hypothetical protein